MLRLPSRQEHEGVAGFFGQVGPETHYLYETFPAPGVAALRLVHDLQHTRRPGNVIWNLPNALRPEVIPEEDAYEDEEPGEVDDDAIHPEERPDRRDRGRDEIRPTANLLGWGPAVRLTNEQRQILKNCGVQDDGFADHLVRFELNNGVFEAIADRIRASVDKYKCGASLHEHKSGSQARCPYIEKGVEDVAFSRNQLYCEGSVRAACAYQLDTRFSVAARVMAYGMRKEPTNDIHNWCYDFNRYHNVPEDWIATRNTAFRFGQVDKLNALDKHTAFTEKDRLRTPLLASAVVKKCSF